MKSIIASSLAVLCLAAAQSARAEDSRYFEMRTYYANEGKLDALHARFRDHTMKLFEKHGMENIGYWVPADNKDNALIYVLAYPSREARDKSWEAFRADADWQAAYAASTVDGKLVNRVESRFMTATDYSPKIATTAATGAGYFELRVYHTNEGKLADLDARFRDHTMAIFESHGMENLAYWHLTEGQPGADSTLVYILGYKDAASRGTAWGAFGQDPKWQSAYAASITDGRLVQRVESVEMTETDYSPE